MEIVLGLLIIAIGSFGQSSCYVPINKIKNWSWESYWIVQEYSRGWCCLSWGLCWPFLLDTVCLNCLLPPMPSTFG